MKEISREVMQKHVIFYLQMKECVFTLQNIKWNAKFTKKFVSLKIIRNLVSLIEKYNIKTAEIVKQVETSMLYKELSPLKIHDNTKETV
jgi:hypothetical protein